MESILSTLESLPNLEELKVKSGRSEVVKKLAENIKQQCLLEVNRQKLELFSTEFADTMKSALESEQGTSRSQHVIDREKMWTTFFRLRQNKLPSLWRQFLHSISCSSATQEPLFMELVNEVYFENMVKKKYAATHCKAITSTSLTVDEENIIRYACGFVGKKLHDRFIKQHGRKAAEFVECIDSMHVAGEASSFLDYTREWVNKVNRGGLFYVSDCAYNLFVAIEIAMQVELTNHIHSSYKLSADESRKKKKEIIDGVMGNDDILFHWNTLAIDISNQQDSMELLGHIVELWMTIRGFSISKAWMDKYKRLAQAETAKKSLRKEMKKKHDAED